SGAAEHHERPVARGPALHAAMALRGVEYEPALVHQQAREALAQTLQEARGPFDVGEQVGLGAVGRAHGTLLADVVLLGGVAHIVHAALVTHVALAAFVAIVARAAFVVHGALVVHAALVTHVALAAFVAIVARAAFVVHGALVVHAALVVRVALVAIASIL